MAKNANYVSHKKSKLKNQDGSPQLPSASALVEGEIAINFAENVETLSIKNESGHVVTFSSDNYYTEKKLGSGFTGQNSANTVTSVIEDNELVWTNAFVSLSGITSAHTANTEIHVTAADKEKLHTHSNKTALDSITGNVGTMAYQNVASYSSATEVNTALENKANTATTLNGYGITDAYTKSETSGATEISNALGGKVNSATYTGHTADTTIHFTTGTVQTQIDNSISGKVNTSDIISAITPSNSGSTAPIATKVVAENELTVSNALNDLNAALSGKVDTTEYSTFSAATNTSINDLSGQTETIAAALVDLSENKVDTTTVTAHTSDTDIHLSETDRLIRDTLTRRTRKDFTASGMTYFVNILKSAIADQCLEKYGMKVGDYYSVIHDGKTYNYVIAGLNPMKGTSTPYRLNINHIGIIVDTNATQAWNVSGNTYQSTNTYSTGGTWTTGTSAAGYANCDLHYYLTDTVLPNVKNDLGSSNIKNHYKLYSNAVNTSGYNRYGSAGGCSSSWTWYANQEICALSEVQVYGSIVWSSSGYDTGEACRQLDVFRVYNMNEIFEGRYPWLRDVASASNACLVYHNGCANDTTASHALYVAALILFA